MYLSLCRSLSANSCRTVTLKSQARLWEDFYDRALAEQRASEPREPLETVKKRVLGRPRRRG